MPFRSLAFVSVATLILALSARRAGAAEADAGAPFGVLPLIDEVDTGNAADPHPVFEDPPGGSKLVTLLGRPARAMDQADAAKIYAYKIGKGKGLVAGKAYLLVVEYPEDAGRQIVIVNRGAEQVRTLSTGATIGDAREGYTYPSPESLKIPLSGQWKAHRSLFYLHEHFQGIKGYRESDKRVMEGGPADGFWVVIGQFRKKDSPLDAGAATAKIRLFEVPAPEKLDVAVRWPAPGLPRRHLFWREEMADGITQAKDPARNAFSTPLAWYQAKMKTARFLGVDTYAKDLLEFGYTQDWDTAPGGGNDWFYTTPRPELWGQLVDAASAHGLSVMPYYEYAGAMGNGTGGAPSYGKQRHCRPLGDRPGGAYSDVSWSEIACIDVTDPAALADVKKLLDATVVRFKGRAAFLGAWFRTRSSNWPISFTDETLGRYAKESGVTVTRASLKADPAALTKYYGWWLGKRKAYLVAIRDHLRAAGMGADVMFTAYIEEALHVPTYADWATPTDDLPALEKVNTTDPWKWRFGPTDWTKFVEAGKFGEMLTRMTPPSAETYAKAWPEDVHSAPPADPKNYVDVDDVTMAMPFSRLFTTSSAAQLDAFRAKSGLVIVRHFNLNEEDGQNAAAPEGPMSKRVGYFVSDVDRAGPYSVLAEARAVANGDPRTIGYLSSSSFNRGFPEYVRAFDAAFLALPALPSKVVSGASSDPEVVVREIPTAASGTYYAVVNVGLLDKKDVSVRLPADGVVTELVPDKRVERGSAKAFVRAFYPGELVALHVGATPPPPADDAGPIDPGADAGAGGDGGVGDAPTDASTGCGCRTTSSTSSGAATLAWLGALGLVALRRRTRVTRAGSAP